MTQAEYIEEAVTQMRDENAATFVPHSLPHRLLAVFFDQVMDILAESKRLADEGKLRRMQ